MHISLCKVKDFLVNKFTEETMSRVKYVHAYIYSHVCRHINTKELSTRFFCVKAQKNSF